MENQVTIRSGSIESEDAKTLIHELNQILTVITGDDGTVNFSNTDVENERSTFLIARVGEEAFGCGALRRLSDDTAEIKRVYARHNKLGIGSRILEELEKKAADFGYRKLLLETRVQNVNARNFYEKNGYLHCEAYGKYVGRENSYCYCKELR